MNAALAEALSTLEATLKTLNQMPRRTANNLSLTNPLRSTADELRSNAKSNLAPAETAPLLSVRAFEKGL